MWIKKESFLPREFLQTLKTIKPIIPSWCMEMKAPIKNLWRTSEQIQGTASKVCTYSLLFLVFHGDMMVFSVYWIDPWNLLRSSHSMRVLMSSWFLYGLFIWFLNCVGLTIIITNLFIALERVLGVYFIDSFVFLILLTLVCWTSWSNTNDFWEYVVSHEKK